MSKNYTLWNLLKEYKIVIPIIQRDYAQGRKGRETIRRNLIIDIYNTLKDNAGRKLSMDFVYGEEIKDTLYPLDGQQRLTTLWLVHWYVLFMAQKEYDEKDLVQLKKFRYETRDSSTDFCECMCSKSKLEDLKQAKNDAEDAPLDKLIRSRTWFMSEWLNDPTIDAMLRTLSGDEDSRKDCIESIFKKDDDNYTEFWKKLIKESPEESPITFELQPIGDEKMPPDAADEIYIKMNARGKPLSDFENFKSDLIAWINSSENPDNEKMKEKPEGDSSEKTYASHFASQIDNAWTDVFWNAVKDSEHMDFDPLYFSFINRFVVNMTILKKDKDSWLLKESLFKSIKKEEYDKVLNDLDDPQKKLKKAYDKLYGDKLSGKNADDSKVTYDDFEYYKDYLTFESLEKLDKIFKALKNSETAGVIAERLKSIKNEYSFIPTGSYDTSQHRVIAHRTEMQERVYFYATCRFIYANQGDDNDKPKPEKTKTWKKEYKSWMRVIHNLVRNYYFNDVADMVSCMRLIAELSDNVFTDKYTLADNGIYNGIVKDKNDVVNNNTDNDDDEAGASDDNTESKEEKNIKKRKFYIQLKEEKEKARAIMNGEATEETITEAENYNWFNGSIRFLYYENGNTVNWGKFKKLFESAKIWFPEIVTIKNEEEKEEKENTVPVQTVQALLSGYTQFADIRDRFLFISTGYADRDDFCWQRHILCNEDLRFRISDQIKKSKKESEDVIEKIKKAIDEPMISVKEDTIDLDKDIKDNDLKKLVKDAIRLQENVYTLLNTEGTNIVDKLKNLKTENNSEYYANFVNNKELIQHIISNKNGQGKIRVSPYIIVDDNGNDKTDSNIHLNKMKGGQHYWVGANRKKHCERIKEEGWTTKAEYVDGYYVGKEIKFENESKKQITLSVKFDKEKGVEKDYIGDKTFDTVFPKMKKL